MENNIKIVERLATLESQTIQGNIIVEKLETAIDRLSDVSASLKEMIALNAHRITQVESDVEKNKSDNLTVEAQHDRRINDLRESLSVLTATLDTHLRKETDALVEQNTALEEIKANLAKMGERIGALEKWRWLIVGGAGVIYFLFTFGTNMLFKGYTVQQEQHSKPQVQHTQPQSIHPQ